MADSGWHEAKETRSTKSETPNPKQIQNPKSKIQNRTSH
jgi:hypothetical protein